MVLAPHLRKGYVQTLVGAHRSFRDKWDSEEERGADTFFAGCPDTPTVHLDQVAGNRESESSTARPPCRGTINLCEALEDQVQLFLRNADTRIRYADHDLLC